MTGRIQDQEDLLAQIQEKRKEMYLFAKLYGVNAEKTIICSQELDILLNKYQLQQLTKSSITSKIPRKSVANSFIKQQRILQYAK